MPTISDIRQHFLTLSNEYNLNASRLQRQYNFIATIRVILFLVVLVLCFWFIKQSHGIALVVLVLLFPLLFGILVRFHNRVGRQRDIATNLHKLNEQEIQRMDHHFHELPEGIEFKVKGHPYTHDLDIFGRNSLFQLINRTTTPTGGYRLASWLSGPATEKEIKERQTAVKELNPLLNWRQHFQATGIGMGKDGEDIGSLLHWAKAANLLHKPKLTGLIAYLSPILSLTLLAMVIFTGLSFYYLIGALVVNGLIIKKFSKQMEELTIAAGQQVGLLRSYGELIEIIERADFKSGMLQSLQKQLRPEGVSASMVILKLQKILDFLNGRANLFYMFINLFLLFDLHILLMTERWKSNHGEQIGGWFDAIGAFEALNSMAAFSYANPEYTFPRIVGIAGLQAKGLGHPLIAIEERVTNNFSLKGEGHIALITGSNMSGKSTFLRTVGVNVVLALAGGPVNASQMELGVMQVFTSMRTEDNLEEHISSFYAELKRIRQVLDLLKESHLPVLFMLDEILKGTNSHDRHRGAEALIRQLSLSRGLGFVSTHDLALGKLGEQMDNISNYSFNSTIQGDNIHFDYQLTQGLCHSFNASKLMEKMGIAITTDTKKEAL